MSLQRLMHERKMFLDKLAKRCNITQLAGKLTSQDISKLERKVAKKYSSVTGNNDSSLLKASNSWKIAENRKQFMDTIALHLNIQKPSDWGKITSSRIFELGGVTMLKNYYKGSLFACLQTLYPSMCLLY